MFTLRRPTDANIVGTCLIGLGKTVHYIVVYAESSYRSHKIILPQKQPTAQPHNNRINLPLNQLTAESSYRISIFLEALWINLPQNQLTAGATYRSGHDEKCGKLHLR